MSTSDRRPAFRTPKVEAVPASPEELFSSLPERQPSHGFLRGQQQDVLRGYAEADSKARVKDVAFELPTGTGKTAVGILIAEWKRRSGAKVAYLSLTNQLAAQVLAEGKRLGIPCADLRGTKDSRNKAEEGRFRTGSALGVTTYPNLFNVKPVLQECDLLVFDDAHGAEQYVCRMWTVTVDAIDDKQSYDALLGALSPGLSKPQLQSILDKDSGYSAVEMVDIQGHPEILVNVPPALENVKSEDARFAWKQIKSKLRSCLFLCSSSEIVIRPLVPPTHTHAPFADAKQRIYMSATLGGESDLQRTYGIDKLVMLRAKIQQWGKRYIFVPGLHVEQGGSELYIASVWDSLKVKRAVLLTPSRRVRERIVTRLEKIVKGKLSVLGAKDIADSLDPFVTASNVVLALAGRYDGLDFPDEQCRFLIMCESPATINSLERHLSERWKMGPILRKRERTRLIQGLGRCTRTPTDFAVVAWLGQSMVNASTSRSLLEGLPAELRAEIQWGVQQSELAATAPNDFISMMVSLVEDADYRKNADADLASVETSAPTAAPKDYEEAGLDEVRYSKAMWDDDFKGALEIAHQIADRINDPDLAGYRAWWWYLASVAASLTENKEAEQDALRRGASCQINTGWLKRLLDDRKAAIPKDEGEIEPNGEQLWEYLANQWGWAGPAFDRTMNKMLKQLQDANHKAYHEGLEVFGKCFGAKTTRITEAGAPDVVWAFPVTNLFIPFEAKTEKKPDGKLSKGDLLEAKGHVDWVKSRLCDDPEAARIKPIVISPTAELDHIAPPFADGLNYLHPGAVHEIAVAVADKVRELRVTFSGRDYSQAKAEFSAMIRKMKLDLDSLRAFLLAHIVK